MRGLPPNGQRRPRRRRFRRRKGGASRAKCAGGERDHDQERAERGELGDVAQGMDGNVYFGLLEHEKFILCSCYVLVNGDGSHLLPEWLTRSRNRCPRRQSSEAGIAGL